MSSFVLYSCASYVRVGRSLLPLLRRPCFQFGLLVCVYVCQQEKLLCLLKSSSSARGSRCGWAKPTECWPDNYTFQIFTPLKMISITPRTTAEVSNNYSVCKHKKHTPLKGRLFFFSMVTDACCIQYLHNGGTPWWNRYHHYLLWKCCPCTYLWVG